MTFDIRPIWIIAALCSAGFGFLVLLLRRSYSDYLGRALTYWGVAFLFFAGMFLLCLGGHAIGPFFSIVMGRTLGAVGFAFEYWAITSLKRQRYSRGWLAAPPVLLFAALLWFTYVHPNVGSLLAVSKFTFVLMMLRNGLSMARSEDGHRPFADVAGGFAFLVLALSTLFVAVGSVRTSYATANYDFNGGRLIYNTVAAIVVEGMLFGLFLLAVSERLNSDFRFLATHDSLTELYNRQTFEEIGHHEVLGAARTGQPLSLFLVGIDHFKRFNDEYGLAIGDFILKASADALQRCLREEDYVCRWGSGEFCALLPNTSREFAETAAARAVSAFEEMDIAVEGERVRVEISIGIVSREGNALAFPALMQLADVALHQAKERERDRFAFA